MYALIYKQGENKYTFNQLPIYVINYTYDSDIIKAMEKKMEKKLIAEPGIN